MKSYFLAAVSVLAGAQLSLAQVRTIAVQGEVLVRHGVDREWQKVHKGLELKVDDSMMSGERSNAMILVDGKKRIRIPENTIVDLIDFRSLTRQELLLQLALERVRAVAGKEGGDPAVPQTTVSHGTERGEAPESVRSLELGRLQLNGSRVLFDNGYYATCALKAKEVLRLYPELSHDSEVRFMIARALEKENLHGEALTEYASLVHEDLSPRDREFVKQQLARLRK